MPSLRTISKASYALGGASQYTQITRWRSEGQVPSRGRSGSFLSLAFAARLAIATPVIPLPPQPTITSLVAGGSGTTSLVYSADGSTWIPGSGITFTSCTAVGYGGGNWVAAGKISSNRYFAVSTDGKQWTMTGIISSLTADCVALAYGSGRWVGICSDGKLIYSNVGTTWNISTSTPFTTNGYSVVYGGNKFVAGGNGTNTTCISTDGISWTDFSSLVTNGAQTIVTFDLSGSTAYLTGNTVDATNLYLSTDGISWTPQSTLGFEFTDSGGMPVGISTLGIRSGGPNIVFIIASSIVPNSQKIQRRVVGGVVTTASTTGGVDHLNAVTYYDGLWYGAGNNKIVSSSNEGLDWTAITTGLTSVNAIASKV